MTFFPQTYALICQTLSRQTFTHILKVCQKNPQHDCVKPRGGWDSRAVQQCVKNIQFGSRWLPKGSEVQENSWNWLAEQGLTQADSGDNKMRSCIQEPENRGLVEFMDRQILELEEELVCPVCLEVATEAPIYKCPDDHLMCRCTIHLFDPSFTTPSYFRICRPKLSECPQCRVELSLSYKRFRGAERQAERLLALRVEKMTIS